eukprot:m.52253 g.52253  ORF g.52253 m.52253 type:complete len:126 (-) comp10778_c0_seq1:293-670(-)
MSVPCGDIREFMRVLRELRKVDDLVKHQFNKALKTASFETDHAAECKKVHSELTSIQNTRVSGIQNCVDTLGQKILSMKESGASNDAIRIEQSTLNLMKRELNTEDLLKETSEKVYLERCGRHLS